MTGSGGVSSTPQFLDSIIGLSEYWIARFRGRRRFDRLYSLFIKRSFAFSRRDAPE
jgi:hypothetical protein